MDTKASTTCGSRPRACTRITLIRLVIGVGLWLATVLPASATALPRAVLEDYLASEIVTFSVTGDVPYGSSEVSLFQDQIDEHDLYSPSEFLVHVGDILAGSESCSESRYQTVRNILLSSEVPCYIVPGDNETSDCSNPSLGLQFWFQYFLGIDDNWACSPSTSRQSGRQENFAFVHKGVLFLGIHLVGGSNNNGVLQDDADWVDAKLQQHEWQVRGAVIFAQAGPNASASTFFNQFETSATNFGKPILYVQGDGHSWKDDTPFDASNVRRIQVNNGGDELPVQITAGLDVSSPQSMFSYQRDPWGSGSDPVDRPPCDGGPPPTQHTLVVTVQGSGTVDLTPPGNTYDEGTVVTLSANPTSGWYFDHWEGDLAGASNPEAITMISNQDVTVVFAPNQAPMASSDAYSVDEDLVLDVPPPGVLANDTDPENDPLGAFLVTPPSNGVLDLVSDGSLSYVPNADFNGIDTFTYEADDGRNGTSTAVVTITVDPRNDAPSALGDSWTTGVSTSLTIDPPGVLANDTDIDGDALTAFLLFGTTHGTVNLATDGSFVYTPDPGYNGPDAFTYEASDGTATAQASVDITVGEPLVVTFHPTDDAHVRTGSSNNYGGATTLRVRNDSSSYHTYLKFQVTGLGSVQSATLRLYVTDKSPHGGWVYSVSNDYAGTSSGWTESGLHSGNAPSISGTPLDDAGAVTAGDWIELDVTAAVNGNGVYSYGIRSSSANSVYYSSKEGSFAPELVVESGGGAPANTAPSALADAWSVPKNEVLTVSAPGVLANDTDIDGDLLTAVLEANVSNGSLSLATDGSFVYTPNLDYAGSDSFTYRARDDSLLSSETTVDLTITDGAPATITLYPLADAHAYSGNPTSNYGDRDHLRARADATTYESYLKFEVVNTSVVQQATLRMHCVDGSPFGGAIHPVSNDYEGTSTPWEESGLHWDNAPPVVEPALDSRASVQAGTWVEFDLSAAITGEGTYSFCVRSNSRNSVRYSSKEGSDPPELVLHTQGSGNGNTPPEALPESYVVEEDQVLMVAVPGVLENDTDPDADSLTVTLESAPANGELQLANDGSFTYAPNPDFDGADSFVYRAHDGRGGTDTALVDIDLTPVNDAPVGTSESYSVASGGRLQVAAPGVLSNDADVDGDSLSVVLESDVASGTLNLNADGSLTYTPDAAFTGNDSFVYRAMDTSLQSEPVTVTIAVGSTPPVSLVFEEVRSGGSSGSTRVSTTSPFASGGDDLYLAAIANKPYRAVTSVTGLGLAWSQVRSQCAGRNQTGVEVWMARGASSGGSVDATCVSTTNNMVLSVARYSGVHAGTPIGSVVSANTNGLSGVCSGGTDGSSYDVPLSVVSNGMVFAAIAMRNRSHAPGPDYVEQDEVHQGSSGGQQASVALMDREVAPGSLQADGSFSRNVDWAMIALVIRAQDDPVKPSASSRSEMETALERLPLYRVFPNPVVSSASIVFEFSPETSLAVSIYNTRGQLLRTLAPGLQTGRRALFRWDTRDKRGTRVPAGVYFVRFEMGTRTLARKIVLQR